MERFQSSQVYSREILSQAPNPLGLCECGCGEITSLAPSSQSRDGWTRGQPLRFVRGHNGRKHPPQDYPPQLCLCGCGEHTQIASRGNIGLGWVKGRPHLYLHGHHARKPLGRILDPDQGYYRIEPGSGCWIWLRSRTGKGYGRFQDRRLKSQAAHRAAYELVKGPVAEGLELDHICNTPACINPDHLEQVTTQENHKRAVERRGEKTRETQLEEINALRALFAGSDDDWAVHESGCWIWLRGMSKQGYGRVWVPEERSSRYAHRVLYHNVMGPIPEGLHLDHTCELNICVNPEHLEPVTGSENARRRWVKVNHLSKEAIAA